MANSTADFGFDPYFRPGPSWRVSLVPQAPTRRYTTTAVKVGCETVTSHPDGNGRCVVRLGKQTADLSVADLKAIAQALLDAAADCEAELPKAASGPAAAEPAPSEEATHHLRVFQPLTGSLALTVDQIPPGEHGLRAEVLRAHASAEVIR